MRVVLDSNIIMSTQFQFRTAHMAAVLAAAPQLHLEILLPEVVVEECCELYRRELQDRWSKYRKSLHHLSDILSEQIPSFVDDQFCHHAASSYRTDLEKRLYGGVFRRVYLPDIDQRDILYAAVSKRKPFGGNDGYRDYLIWRTVVSELERDSTDSPLYFLSENHTDFAESPESNVLHPDFISDLREHGLPPDAVIYYKSVRAFQDEVINPQLHFLREMSARVLREEFENRAIYDDAPQEIDNWFANKLRQVSVESFGLPSSVDWIESACVLEITRYSHAEARSIHNDHLTIDLVVDALCEFVVEVDQHSDLGVAFSNSHFVVGPQTVTGSVRKALKFVMTSLVGPAPERVLIRMDAVLLSEAQKGT